MIQELTQQQKNKRPKYKEKWTKIGLSTEPIDVDKAKKFIKKAYASAGMEPPKHFYVFDSPIAAIDGIKAMVGEWKTEEQIIIEMSYGNMDAHWLGFYDYFEKIVGLDCVKPLDGLIGLAHHCGWWSAYQNIAVLQQRPLAIHKDDEERLHNPSGLAVEYRDGYGFCAWHGTVIPNEWILQAPPSPEEALKWPNVEQRRAACEILGWDQILTHLDAQMIDVDPNPQIGILLEVDLPGSGLERFLKVECGTQREFILPVPPNMKTAREANAWTYNVSPEEYEPEVRT